MKFMTFHVLLFYILRFLRKKRVDEHILLNKNSLNLLSTKK